jgi:hypothetical protein
MKLFQNYKNLISGVKISVLAMSVVYRGSSPDRVKPKTIKLVFVVFPLSMHIKEKDQRLVGTESDNVSGMT